MRIPKYADSPEPGMWVPMSASDVANWRKAAFERVGGGRARVFESRGGGVVRGKGGTLERDVIRVNETTSARHHGDQAELDVDQPTGIREARETVQILASDILAWVREKPELYEERVKHLVSRAKAAGALAHLSDEDAARQVHELAQKLAEGDAERGYAEWGHNRPQVLDGRF